MKCTSLPDHHTGGAYSAPRPPSWWEGEHPVARTPSLSALQASQSALRASGFGPIRASRP